MTLARETCLHQPEPRAVLAESALKDSKSKILALSTLDHLLGADILSAR